MKYVLLSIFVLFAAQPLQVSACDMAQASLSTGSRSHLLLADQGTAHSQHEGAMPDMDCCDHPPSDTDDGCGSMSHCGASTTAGVAAIHPSAFGAIFISSSQPHLALANEPLSRSGSPPFRPPIA